MVLTLTDKLSVVTQYIVDLLRENWYGVTATDKDIYYGDEPKYPRYPSVAVEAGPHLSPLTQTGLQMQHEFTIYILIIHAPITDQQTAKKDTDQRAEAVRDILHTDRRLGGLVIHGHVGEIEPGFVTRGGEKLVASRLTWTGISKSTIG